MKAKLKPSDQTLFRHAMRGVKPLKTVKVELSRPVVARRKRRPIVDEVQPDNFSDHDVVEWVDSKATLAFARSSVSSVMLRRLRQGRESIEAILDLHGQRAEEARQALYHFLLASQAEGKVQLLIIHGKGRGNAKPVLKNKLNNWLRQSDQVLAFCSAQPKDGGTGALYVRIRRA